MISEREKYERFENYLKGMMDEVSKTAFEKELGNDEKLYHEFIDYRQAHNLIFESRLLDIRQELQSIHTTHLKARRLWRNTGGIVIMAGLIITAVFLYNRYQIREEKIENTEPPVEISDSMQPAGNSGSQSVAAGLEHRDIHHNARKTDTTALKILSPAEKTGTTITQPVDIIINKELSPDLILNTDTLKVHKAITNENEMKKPVSVTDCSQTEIKCDYNVESTCEGRSQGKIIFHNQTLKGGVPPYEFSINNGASYFNHALFINLQEGTYRLLIRDGNHCTSYIGTAEVAGYECDFRFAPSLGEVWDIPFINEHEGVLRIISKEGKLLYISEVGQYSKKQWDGRTQNGDILPLGVYMFTIELTNGTIYNGTVTIIK